MSPSSRTVTAGRNGDLHGHGHAEQRLQRHRRLRRFRPAGGRDAELHRGSTLTVDDRLVAPGTYPFTITGTSGALSHTTAATLVVQAQAPPAGFSVGVSPSSTTVTAGTSASYSVTVSTTGGFPGTVNLSQSGLPNGTFTPGSVTGGGGSTLTVATGSIAPGTYPFTITGTSGATTHSASATLVVQAAPPPPQGDFSISATPTSRFVLEPATTSYTVKITPTNGFDGQVSLSATGFVPGVTGSFAPNPGTSTSTFTVQVSGVKATRTGTRVTLTITGTSGSLSHSATVTLIVI